jgi:plasmid stability protein
MQASEKIRVQTRYPADIHQWLTERAARNNRSMNGELVDILEKVKEEDEQKPKQAA